MEVAGAQGTGITEKVETVETGGTEALDISHFLSKEIPLTSKVQGFRLEQMDTLEPLEKVAEGVVLLVPLMHQEQEEAEARLVLEALDMEPEAAEAEELEAVGVEKLVAGQAEQLEAAVLRGHMEMEAVEHPAS